MAKTIYSTKTTKTINKYGDIFKRVDDIEIPEILFHPTKTGTPELDNSFSEMGGVTPSCVTLVTGTPGAGKTTLMATMGARLQSPRPVVFLSYEMSDFQTKLTAKKIDGFEKMLIVSKEFHKGAEGKKAFLEFLNGPLTELNPSLVIVDSLQKMAGSMTGSYNNNQIWLTEAFTKFAKETFVPVNMIGHVSKDGTYKGPTTIKHEVDAHMHISIDKELGERVFSFSKNRFGGVADPYIFRITSHGVYIGEEWWMKAGNTDTVDMAKNAICEFKAISEKSQYVPFKAFQKMTKDVMRHLSTAYRSELLDKGVAKTADVKLTWKGTRAFCRPSAAQINFGQKFFKDLTDANRGRIGYKSEKEFINRNCQSKEDVALWVVFHEFAHLFQGRQKHVKSFFRFIEKTWNEQKAIFA